MIIKKLISSPTKDLIRPLIVGAFDATNIPSNVLWLDTADEDTITEVGGFVSQLDDKSGQGNHAVQAIGSDQPLTGTTTQNGLNTFVYDGVDDFLQSTLTTKITGSECTYIIVARRSVFASSTSFFNGVGDGQIRDRDNIESFVGFNSFSNDWIGLRNDVGLDRIDDAGDNITYIATGMYDGSFNSLFRNGLGTGSPNASTGNFDLLDFYIGSRFSLAPCCFFTGEIMEVLVYGRALSTDELGNVHNYLSDKWAVPLE